MSRKKPPHYSNAKIASGAHNAASKKKKDKKRADKAKNKRYNGKELGTCAIPTTDVSKKRKNIPPSQIANAAPNAVAKKQDESTVDKAKNKQNNSKELETCTISTTGVSKKGETVASKIANGALNAGSKKKDESTAEKAKNKLNTGKELETGTIPTKGEAKKRETVAPITANGGPNVASKKKKDESTSGKASQKVELDQCIIPTTGVARKRKNVPPPGTANGSANEQRNGGAKLEGTMPAKKRPRAAIDSESNSEAEDYIDKFFIDALDDMVDLANGNGATEDSEDADDYDTDADDGELEEDEDGFDVDDDDGEAMPFDDLLNYFGQRRDMKEKQKLKLTAEKKSPAAPKASTSGWIVEDNDRDLRYETEYEGNASSDEEGDAPRKKKTKTPAVAKKSMVRGTAANVSPGDEVAKFRHETTEDHSPEEWDDDDFSDEFSGSDEALDSNSDMWTDASEEEYFEEGYDDSNSDGSEDSGVTYLQQPYDSDSYDEDYVPSDSECEQEDEQCIPRGMAQIYDIDDDSISFDEGVSQIVELPNDSGTEGKHNTTDAPSDTDAQSDTSIPVLVPIYNKQGEFIDSPEKLKKQPEPTESAKPTTIGGAEAKQVVPPREAMETDVNETSEKADSLKENEIKQAEEATIGGAGAKQVVPPQEAMETDVNETSEKADSLKENEIKQAEEDDGEEFQESSSYRFYDAVEGRMALVVLKQEIYFYGQVSVQALSGRVEILGYRLETGETRTVKAARGYNAVNLVPLPSTEPFDTAFLETTLKKLKSNFIDADIRELIESFDPKESVLVLLHADQAEAGLLPIICNFLEDYNLFPTVNTLPGKLPFRRTELLLEVEFFTPTSAPKRSIPVFQNDPAWDAVQLQASSRVLVVGGKGAGKSTLCQFLVNRFVRQFGRILLIDLDIGQPLLHLPETINASVLHDPILGVGCFAKVQPLRSLLFGSLNVVSSPVVYVQNVRTLLQHCEANPDLNGVPWIVNTMGYVSGFGEELMAAIVRLVQPTDLIQLTIPKHMKNVQNYQNTQTDSHVNGYKFKILKEEMDQFAPQQQRQQLTYQLHPMVVSFVQRGLPLHPPKRRALSIMSHLVQILGHTTEWFTDVKPFCAPLDELQILITRDEYTPSKEMLPSILNAMMVYLCERLDNGQYSCLGVGIVRAVDHNNNVHLLHYLPPDQLARVKVLALCTTSLPSQIYLRLNTKMDGIIPYLQNVG